MNWIYILTVPNPKWHQERHNETSPLILSLDTQDSYPPGNLCFQVYLNKLRNKQGNPDNFETSALSPHYSFVQCSSVIFGFSAPQVLKEAVTALCLDNCPSLSSGMIFQLLKDLVTFTGHIGVEIYKRLSTCKVWMYKNTLCLYFNIMCLYFTHTQTYIRKDFHWLTWLWSSL